MPETACGGAGLPCYFCDMVRQCFFSLCLVFLAFSPQVKGQDELPPVRLEPSMKGELELSYEKWRRAMLTRDLKGWEDAVAMYRRIETRNRIVSERQPYPDALFDSPIQPPSLRNLILVGIMTRRDTASAVYFGKADYGISDPDKVANTFLVLRFLKEEGAWRFDNNRIIRIGKDTEVLHLLRMSDFSFLKGSEFQPLDSIPPIPQPVPTPERMAEAWVTSIGYEAEIWVNGFRLGKISNNQGRELVMGGVKRGSNQIRLVTKKLPGVEARRFEIAIYAADDPGKEATRVFHFGPTAEVAPMVQQGFHGSGKQ